MSNQYSPNYTGVQIALSTNCNLLCPGCNRTHFDNDKFSLNPIVTKTRKSIIDQKPRLSIRRNTSDHGQRKITSKSKIINKIATT